MSCYEWEAGTIKIPSASWAAVKAGIREAYNKRQEALFAIASEVHAELAVKLPDLKKQLRAKTLAKYHFDDAVAKIVHRHMELHVQRTRGRSHVHNDDIDLDDSYDIRNSLIVDHDPKTGAAIPLKLRKPQKKDFPICGNNVNRFELSECSVTFDNDARSVRWQVHENNHAVDRARQSVLGVAFFAAMEKVEWTRGTGGSILGNNEYNRDAGRDYDGGGGTMTVQTYSMEQQQADRLARKRESSMFSGYGRYGGGGFRR